MGTKSKKTVIAQNVLSIIAVNPLIKGKLCDRYGRSHATIAIWIRDNNAMLTTIDSLEIIKSELDLPVQRIIVERD